MTKVNRKAEEEVLREILEEMADSDGKVPKFKGGRFIAREGVSQ